MAGRVALCLAASWVLLATACSFRGGGLGVVEGTEDSGILIGTPGTGGQGAAAGNPAGTGGSISTGGMNGAGMNGSRTGGTGGTLTGGAPGADAGPVLPPPDATVTVPTTDAAVIVPPPDAAVMPPPSPAADAAPLSPPPPDAAPLKPPLPGNSITCGATSCAVGKEACCVGPAAACIPREGACLGAIRRCDGPEDCEGNAGGPGGGDDRVCCARGERAGGFRSICTRAAECLDVGGVPVCRSEADCPRQGRGGSCAPTNFSGTIINTCQR